MTDTTNDTTAEPLAEHEWIYAGRRYIKEKLWHYWLDHNDKRAMFDKAPAGPAIGGRYVVKATENSSHAAPSQARFVGTVTPDDERLPGWRVEDRAASAALEADRFRKRAGRENGDIGDMTLGQLRAQMRGKPMHLRTGTVAAVLAYLAGPLI